MEIALRVLVLSVSGYCLCRPGLLLAVLCLLLQIGAIPALISSAVAVGIGGFSAGLGSGPDAALTDLERGVIGSHGFLMAVCCTVIIVELVIIVARKLNIGLINLNIKAFLTIVSEHIIHLYFSIVSMGSSIHSLTLQYTSTPLARSQAILCVQAYLEFGMKARKLAVQTIIYRKFALQI